MKKLVTTCIITTLITSLLTSFAFAQNYEEHFEQLHNAETQSFEEEVLEDNFFVDFENSVEEPVTEVPQYIEDDDEDAWVDTSVPDGAISIKSIDDETGLMNSGIPKAGRQSSGLIVSYFMPQSNYTFEGVTYNIMANGDARVNKEFVKYLTDSWALANNYTWSKTTTVSWTFGGDVTFGEKVKTKLGLSTSRSTSHTTGTSIPADPTKFSKLAYGSDYFIQNYTVNADIKDSNGKITRTITGYERGYVKTPTSDTYIYPVYK